MMMTVKEFKGMGVYLCLRNIVYVIKDDNISEIDGVVAIHNGKYYSKLFGIIDDFEEQFSIIDIKIDNGFVKVFVSPSYSWCKNHEFVSLIDMDSFDNDIEKQLKEAIINS